MAYSVSDRYSLDSLLNGDGIDNKGKIFLNKFGEFNLSDLNFLHMGIDTIRQLFTGKIKPEFLADLISVYDVGLNAIGTFFGYDFFVSGGGSRSSGYRYRLQNNDLGVIVFVGGFFNDLDSKGSHLKVELSPHFIIERGFKGVNSFLSKVAVEVLGFSSCASGVAVHLCVDYQGFTLPDDFIDNYVTYSRKIFSASGISEMAIDGESVCFNHNRGDTLTFGSTTAIQTTFYNKSKEVIKRDKFDFWRNVWGANYNDKLPVYRFEIRLHQNIIKEYGGYKNQLDGTKFINTFCSFSDIYDYLTDIWRTVLKTNRLMIKKTVLHPFWQCLLEDVYFNDKNPSGILFKRVKKLSIPSIKRNIANFIGNSLTLYARHGYNAKVVLQRFKKCGFWRQILDYISYEKLMTQSEFFQWLGHQLALRRFIGKAA